MNLILELDYVHIQGLSDYDEAVVQREQAYYAWSENQKDQVKILQLYTAELPIEVVRNVQRDIDCLKNDSQAIYQQKRPLYILRLNA